MTDADESREEVATDATGDDPGGDEASDASQGPDVDTGEVPEPVDPLRRGRVDVAAGLVLTVYALWVTVQVCALLISDEAYDALAGLQGGAVARVAFALVVLAALWHTTQGALALVATQVPALARRPGPRRQVVAFVTLAAGIPATLVVLWPALVGIPT